MRQRADQPLAARPQQNRAAEPVEQRKSVQQIEIVPQPLAETDAGIDDDPLAGYPSRFGRRYPALQPRIDLDQRIGIARLVLTRLRVALMIQQERKGAGEGKSV